MSASILASVEMAPRDPILGVTETFNADRNQKKVNLGVGVYYDDNGKIPLLECVRRAERQLLEASPPRGYLPIDGLPEYDRAVQSLVFGAESPACKEQRVVTVQALGGTGGLKVGADFLRRINPQAEVWISQPSWENHRALFENAGFTVKNYPYYDAKTHGLDFVGMLQALQGLNVGTIVVLHACCHNPTGVDLTSEQWDEVIGTVQSRGLIPFLDLAYQGFGAGLDTDGTPVRRFASAGAPLFVSNSFSKSFSLYGERIGALSVVADSSDEAARTLSQLKRFVRTNYSNPPTHGGKIVATVLNSAELRTVWEDELKPDARAHPRHAHAADRKRCRRACRGWISASSSASAACFPTRGCRSRRSDACATSTPSTRSTPAASAWPRSTRRTSTTSPRRSPW